MLNRDQIIHLLQEKQDFLKREFGVSKIGLFGSYIQGKATSTSDIDLFVEFEQPLGFKFFELIDYLENLLDKKVDVLTPAGIQNIRQEHIAETISESIVYV